MLYNTSSLIFLSTLSLRRATQKNQHQRKRKDISIHALLAESDARRALGFVDPDISIHALLAESDNVINHSAHPHKSFLSTLSLRRATIRFRNLDAHCQNFYPRSPCGERHASAFRIGSRSQISIHALLAESDVRPTGNQPSTPGFLSTLSLRRATAKVHKTVEHFCAYETNFMGIASSC